MKCFSCLAFVFLAAAAMSAQAQTRCVPEGEWTKCGPATSTLEAGSATSSSSAVVLSRSIKPERHAPYKGYLQPEPRPRRVADGKFWLVVATPQILNAAYRLKFGSCYPTGCVEGTGLTPNQQFALFAGLNGVLGAVAYKAKKDRSRFWWPVALMLTPLSIYDLQHRPR